jgi:hypothetical protein
LANRYWSPAANANWADANVWATTEGGDPTGIATPTASDDVFFTSTNVRNCAVGASAVCLGLSFNSGAGKYTGTFSGASALAISGSLLMSSTMTFTYTGAMTFNATSGTKTITSAGIVFPQQLLFAGSGGTFQLIDDMTLSRESAVGLVFNAGTFDATTNLTTVTFTGSNSGMSIIVPPTFYNLRKIPTTPTKSDVLSLGGNITVSNLFTVSNGATVTNRVLIFSSVVGTVRTITAASISTSNSNWQDITGAGVASWDMSADSGGSGNCGGNSMKALGDAAFTTAATQTANGTTSFSWSNAARWTSRVPLPQDDVVINNAFGTSQTVTADMPRLGASIDWTGATWTTALTWTNSIAQSLFGSLTLISGLTLSGSNTLTFAGRGSFTLTSISVTFTQGITLNAPTGTLTLGDNLTINSGSSLSIINGTFTAVNGGNNYIISTGTVTGTSGSGTLTLGSAIHLLTGTGFVWSVAALTITAFTGTLKITNTSNTAVTFAGATKTYNNIYWNRGASTGNITISGSNTFADFKDDGTAAHSILITDATTQTFTTFTMANTTNVITINGTSTGTHTLRKTGGGTISADYLNIQHSIAAPAITWYAGVNSTNNQGDATAGRGWIFTVPPTGTGNMMLVF